MKITLEFKNPERFFKELPQFAKAIEFAGQFVNITRVPGNSDDINLEAVIPDTKTPAGVEKTVDAAKAVGIYHGGVDDSAVNPSTDKAHEEKPQEAEEPPFEEDSTKSTPEPVKAESEAPAMPEPTATEYAITDVRKALSKCIKLGKRDEMKKLLTDLGAENVSGLRPEKYAEFIAAAEKIGGANA